MGEVSFIWCTEIKLSKILLEVGKMVLPDDQRQNSNNKISKGKEQDASHSRHQNWYDPDHQR